MTTATDRAVDAAQIGTNIVHDFSMWGLFSQADLIVKIVMLMLMFASVWSWAIILDKRMALKRLNKRANRFEDAFWSGEPLDKLYQRVKKGKQDPVIKPYRSFCNLSEGKIVCVMEAPDKKTLAAWFEKMHVPCDGISPVELEGDRGTVGDA